MENEQAYAGRDGRTCFAMIPYSSQARTGIAATTKNTFFLFKKNLNASKPSGEKLSKYLGGNIGCRDKNPSWYQKGSPMMVVTLGQQYNVGEKPTVILYTYIKRHYSGTPKSPIK